MLTADSNIENVIYDIDSNFADKLKGEAMTELLNVVSSQVLRMIRRRVFTDGKDITNSNILKGKYSTTEAWINPKTGTTKPTLSIPPEGKYGDKIHKDGTPYKTVYLSEGYKQWRAMNNKITDKVNLTFTGDLDRSFTYQKLDEKTFVIGFTEEKEALKAQGNEDRNGEPIFSLSMDEVESIDKIIEHYIEKLYV